MQQLSYEAPSSSSSSCSKEEEKAERWTEPPEHKCVAKQSSFKDAERIELFKKLRNQINKFKNEMYSQSDHNKLSPFKIDPSK